MMINGGRCGRHHDLVRPDIVDGGVVGISLFDGTAHALPHALALVERHPLGSQTFLPMSDAPFLVICAEDEAGVPVRPRAWITDGAPGRELPPRDLARRADAAERARAVRRRGPDRGAREQPRGARVSRPPWRVIDPDGLAD